MSSHAASSLDRSSRSTRAAVVGTALLALLLSATPVAATVLVPPTSGIRPASTPAAEEPPPPPADAYALCDHGYYSATGRGSVLKTDTENGRTTKQGCTAAAPGRHVPAEGATAPTECVPGTYQDESGKRLCKDAALGQFVPAKAATKAELCPAGTYGVKAKATSQADGCRPAEPGSFVATAGQAGTTACAAGTYQPDPGKASCIPAAVGFHVPTAGARSQTPCSTATTTGSKACVAAAPAPEPEPTDEPDAAEDDAAGDPDFVRPDGDPCPPGTWSPDGLVPTASSCTPAAPGTFVAEAGATEEVACPAGTYSGAFGATECTPAEVGFYVPATGASSQLPCQSATEPGAATCGEPIAADTASSGGRLLPILVAFVAVLIAAGAFVLLRQRGLLGGTRPLPSRGDAWAGFDDRDDPDPGLRGGEPLQTQRLPDVEPRRPEPPREAEPPSRPTRRFEDDLFDDDL